MKRYIRTFLTGILGLIGGLITYFSSIPGTIQFIVILIALVGISCMALYEKNLQLKEELVRLVSDMRYHVNYVFVTNGSESEISIEVHELNNHFNTFDEETRIKAISIVYDISEEEVKRILSEELPDYIATNLDVFRMTKRR